MATQVVLEKDEYYTTTATAAAAAINIVTTGEGERTETSLSQQALQRLVDFARHIGWTVN